MTANVVSMTAEQAHAELTQLLREADLTAEELRDRADNYLLIPEQHTISRRVEALLWLIADK